MAINGKQTINIGLPNESAGSDSLYTAFTKVKDNFDVLFANASGFNTFNSGDGISVSANISNGEVTITNAGVTKLTAGTGIVLSGNTGNITISSTGSGGNGGGTVTSVAVVPVSNTRLVVTGSPVISEGNIFVDLATTGVAQGSYVNPLITVDPYGRVTGIANGSISGTVTSVGLTPGEGIQINGGPVTSAGTITVTNTGVTRINAGAGVSVSSGNGNVTISAVNSGGTVTAVGISSSQLVVSGSPVVTSGTINVNLPNTANFSGNVNANRINANGGNINGDLIITGNISPAAVNKVGGIKPGPGVDISLDGELTIDTANLPLSFGNFTANNNVLSIVNVDEDMILQTEGNAEIQLVGDIGFYKPDGLPPNVANRYFSATSDGQIEILVGNVDPTSAAVKITGSTTGNVQAPVNTGIMLHITGQNNDESRLYLDGIGGYAGFIGRRYGGNATAPTQVLDGQEISRHGVNGYTSNGWLSIGQARISFVSTDNQDAANNGAKIEFWTTPKGNTVANREKTLELDASYGANIIGKLSVTGNANVGNLGTSGLIVATGNITGGNLVTSGSANITGNVNAGNLVLTTGNIIYTPRYGSFYSNVTQTNPVANTARAMTFNNTVTANSVSIISNSQITVNKTGVYNIQFSAQVTKSDAGTDYIEIWLDKNGSTIPWTNTRVRLVEAGEINVASWNFVETANSGDYFRLMWGSADTNASLVAIPAASTTMNVDVPSVIVTVTPVGA